MGKRKLHNKSFFQCDWTGFPMNKSYCYMPTWDTNNKLVKKRATVQVLSQARLGAMQVATSSVPKVAL